MTDLRIELYDPEIEEPTKRVFLILTLMVSTVSGAEDDELTVLTDQPGKHLELLLKRQFNEHLDRRLRLAT